MSTAFLLDRSDGNGPMLPSEMLNLMERPAWWAQAACRDVDTALFFPDGARGVPAALAVCQPCRVKREGGDGARRLPAGQRHFRRHHGERPGEDVEALMTDHAAIVPAHTLTWFAAGVPVVAVPGDIGIVRSSDKVGALIRFGEAIHDHGGEAWANHCFAIIDGGFIAQAEAHGIVQTPLSSLTDPETAIVHPTAASPEQVAAAVEFATWCLDIGYGWPSVGADAIDDLTGGQLAMGTGERMVCSTHACRTAERWGLVPDRNPYAVQPDDIARYFGALPPTTLAP